MTQVDQPSKYNDGQAQINELKLETTKWLQYVSDLIEQGRIDTLRPQPTYMWVDEESGEVIDRRDQLTDEVVEIAIQQIEDYFEEEKTKYPECHNTAQGTQPGEVLVTPGFTQMPKAAKRAFVERMDELCRPLRLKS